DERVTEIEGKTIRTGPEWRKLQREGKVPPGSALIPVQEFSRVLQRGAWDEAAGLLDDALAASIREARGEKGKKYALVPRAALQEFRDQMQAWSPTLRRVRTLSRLQSVAMLAAS